MNFHIIHERKQAACDVTIATYNGLLVEQSISFA